MFENKTVIITGGASGMGLLSGQCFAKEGANVLLVDINEKALEQRCGEIRENGGKCSFAVADVRDYKQVCAAKDKAIEEFGSIDILLNCAGGYECRMLNHYEDFADMPIEVYDWGLDVNLKGPFYFAACRYETDGKAKKRSNNKYRFRDRRRGKRHGNGVSHGEKRDNVRTYTLAGDLRSKS